MEPIRLNVPEMNCQGWLISIRLAVRQLDGTGEVEGDWKARLLTVDYDPSAVTVEAIQVAMESIGYDSTLIEVWTLLYFKSTTHRRISVSEQPGQDLYHQMPA